MKKTASLLIITITLLLAGAELALAERVVVVPLTSGKAAACPEGLTLCSGKCVDIQNNPDYCGGCDTQCDTKNYCSNGVCVRLRGESCAGNNECISGYCVDGVCCNNTCTATCQSCLGANTGGSDGTCADITASTDPDNECAGESTCSGTGICRKAQGQACATGAECISLYCVDGFCCNTECASGCEACAVAKTGGIDGTCSDITPYTDPDEECGGQTFVCDATGGCADLCDDSIKNNDETDIDCGGSLCETRCANGNACQENGDCESSNCIGDVCEPV